MQVSVAFLKIFQLLICLDIAGLQCIASDVRELRHTGDIPKDVH